MPDITLCNNDKCPLCKNCYRWTAEPSDWQSYAHFEPEDEKCDYFYPNNREVGGEV